MRIGPLQSLQARAEETSTTALVVWQKGEKLVSFGEDQLVPLFSLTKSIVCLAIGLLFDQEKIPSLDTPVSHWFPEWREGLKAGITVRMLMTHTSGIEDHFIEMDGSFNIAKFNAFKHIENIVEAALKLPVVKEPGTHASYSNSSADILVALVNKIANMPIDQFVKQSLFEPMGITNWQWVSSTIQLFGVGEDNPSGADGLVMTANDLQKVGQMILQNGSYEGKQFLSPRWIKMMSSEMSTPLLKISLGESALTNVPDKKNPGKYLPATDHGEPIPLEPYISALFWLVPQSLASKKNSEVFMGWGFLGQYLIIVPAKKIVAVRLYTKGLPNLAAVEDNTRVSFADFEYWVRKLE